MNSQLPLAFLLAFAVQFACAQNQQLPPEWNYSADGHRLMIGTEPVDGFYEKEVIRTIDMQFSQADWYDQLAANQATNTRIPVTVVIDGIAYDSVGVRFRGTTTPEIAATLKHSFSLDFNHYIAGQNVMGYSTVNLDNASDDPSFLREVIYSDRIRQYIPTPKSNFIHLTINGDDWGLYPNIQQINSPFLEEWFFSNNGSLWSAERPDGQEIGTWGDGTAALNWLGTDTTTYQEYYELERTEEFQPWDHLVRVIDKLNNTPLAELEDTLNEHMNVDRALWLLACENAFGDRDSYTRKGKDDYMIYHVPESDRSTPIQVDGRSTMQSNSVSWTPFHNADDVNYPLLNRLLSVPALRQRYLAHLRTIIAEKLQTPEFNAMLAEYVSLIDAEVQSDPRKLFTYTQFQNEQIALQEFINARRLTLNANFEVGQQGPQVSQTEHRVNGTAWADPLIGESLNVRTTVSSTNGISAVNVYYCAGPTGPFTKLPMFDDGAHDDDSAGDGTYGATLPQTDPITTVRYYVEAISANTDASVSFDPPGAEHDVYVYRVQHPVMVDPPVRINEVLAANAWTVTDNFLEHDDWIELYNNSGEAVDLSGKWLSDNGAILQKWQFPLGSVIQPFGFMIIWADDQSSQGADHASFALSIDGESVWLSEASGLVIDHVEFGAQTADVAYARRPNGVGPFEYQDPTFNINNDMVSVPEMGERPLLRIHPNPATDVLTLICEEPLDIVIHDALMRQMHRGQIRGRSTIDVGQWPAGSYFVKHEGFVEKFIVIR